MYRKIILPVDAPPEARVVDVARGLADKLGARLELVSIVSRGLEQQDDAELEQLARAIGPDIEWRTITEGFNVANQLIGIANEPDALMCLATKARRALTEFVFGSIGEHVIRSSTKELLVVGPHCEARWAAPRVVIAVDGSPESEAIVPAARELAYDLGAMPCLTEITSSGLDTVFDDFEAEYVASLAERAGTSDERPIDYDVLHGRTPHRRLSDITREHDVMMVAMATHGLNSSERLLSGSVTLDVIRDARCPVLVRRSSDDTTA